MREKLINSVKKLMLTKITLQQAYIYFNMYMFKSIFFGIGMIKINKRQIKEIKRIYERPILTKLQLSKTFLKVLLYSRKAFLGVKLIVPEIVITIAILKLYLGYRRIKRNTMTIIKAEEEIVEIMSSQNKEWDHITNQYWKKM